MHKKEQEKYIRLRFAPSPTGFLHIGSLRTVLFDYLAAKSMGGKLILRIEDTDQKREVPGAVQGLINILDWIGISFDEGPQIGGDYGPYVQSQRLEIYKKHADQLLASGQAYRCFCTPERLKEMREEQQAKKMPPRYDRQCRNLSEKEIEEKITNGEKFVIRQKMPLEGEVSAYDELRGEITFQAADLEDHVLLKSDGIPTYQLAVVVDDHFMEISHVIRGEEWIPSFPKNILLYENFGWHPPKFIHMPLTLNKEGGKLSKRQGDVAVEDYKAKGYLPEALLNFCALLGWHPKDDQELLTIDEMIKKFDLQDMGTSPAIFDVEKLDYFNGYYIRQKPINDLVELCLPFLQSYAKDHPATQGKIKTAAEDFKDGTSNYLKNVIALEQERIKKLSDVGELTEFFFVEQPEYPWEYLVWKKMSDQDVVNKLKETKGVLESIPEENWTNDSIGEALMSHIKAVNGSNGEYLWPLRVALTGRKASPGPFEVAETLGKKDSVRRIEYAIELMEKIVLK